MKKLISVIVVLLIITSLSIISFADNGENENKSNKVTINEFIKLKELKGKSNQELKDMGFLDKDIEKLKTIDYKEELKKRSKFDKEILKNCGYTDEKIEMLKNFTGTEDEMVALAAEFTFDADLYAYSYVNDKTSYSVYFSWSWSNLPIFNYTDIIGIGYMTDFIRDTNYQTVRIDYKHSFYNTVQSTYVTPSAVDIGASQCKVPMLKGYGGTNDIDFEWACSGYGQFGICKSGRAAEAAIVVKYGQSYIVLQPSVSAPFGVGIGFSTGVNTIGIVLVDRSLDF